MATLQTTVFSLFSHFVVFLQLKKEKKEKKCVCVPPTLALQLVEPLKKGIRPSTLALVVEATLHTSHSFDPFGCYLF